MDWPGFDEPAIYNTRPSRNRIRLNSEHADPRIYRGPNGQLLVPAGGGGLYRSSSDARPRPAQITIINDNVVRNEDMSDRRHSHGRMYADDYPVRERSRSRVRMRTPSPYAEYASHYDGQLELRDRLRRLDMLEKEDEEKKRESLRRLEELAAEDEKKKRRKRLEEEMVLEEAEHQKHLKDEQEMKKAAVVEWKAKEKENQEKEKAAKEKADKEYETRMRETLWRNGYSEAEIEKMLKKGEKKGSNTHVGEHVRFPGSGSTMIALNRPTFIKVHRKYLDVETLDIYQLPWEYDDLDSNFIIIKQWVNEHDQDVLFEHTRKLRETKLITYEPLEIRKERDKLILVRKKETRKKSPVPARPPWFF